MFDYEKYARLTETSPLKAPIPLHTGVLSENANDDVEDYEFDYEKFVNAFVTEPQPTKYSARFSAPDDKGVWCIMWSGPITKDGVIELMNQDEHGNISIIDIRKW